MSSICHALIGKISHFGSLYDIEFVQMNPEHTLW